MSTRTEALGLFNAGQLGGAIEAATQAVRAAPGDPAPRLLLAELLLFTGAFERVETLLAAAAGLSPDLALVIAEARQLLRAAQLRELLATEGALPSFLGEPTPSQAEALRAHVALRAGDLAQARTAADAAEALRPACACLVETEAGEQRIDDLRDADDLLGGSVEVLTTTGVYYWVPVERIDTMLFHPPARPRDLLWRRCTIAVRGGPEGEVYIPATYRAAPDATDAVRLGRVTEWSEADPVTGQGQRVFLAGVEALPIMSVRALSFETGTHAG